MKSMHLSSQDWDDTIADMRQHLRIQSARAQVRIADIREPGTLHAMMGIPGSGKSTVADDIKQMHNAVRISPDEIRRMLTGDPNNQERNAEVFGIAHGSTKANLAQGNHVIFDATNTKADSRRTLLGLADQTGARKHLHIVDPGLEVSSQRNRDRAERVVPQEILDRMHQEMLDSHQSIPTEGWDEITYH